MLLRAFITVLLLVVGCAHDPYPDAPTGKSPEAHWCPAQRPAHVIVSDALPEACHVAVAEAVEWWRSQGVDYLTVAVVPDEETTPDELRPRYIQVIAEAPEGQGVAGDARYHRTSPSCLDGAEVRLAPFYCREGYNTAAHELGHALGLTHHDSIHNLMFYAGAHQWELDELQRDWVR